MLLVLVANFLMIAFGFGGTTTGLTWLLRDQLFHPVPAHCLSGQWVDGSVSSQRGQAVLVLQYQWQDKVYDTIRTFGPLDDSERMRDMPEDVQRAHDWIAANCRDQEALVMYGMPSIAWFRDQRSWNSVIADVILRSLLVAAIAAAALTLYRRRRTGGPARSVAQ